jgi:transposase
MPSEGGAPAGMLFDPGEPEPETKTAGAPRLRHANRAQASFQMCSLEDMISEEHPVRTVWAYVEKLDLAELLNKLKAVEGRPGSPPADPRILLALWFYATLRGIGSARELDRRCAEDLPFRWLCGEVSMNYHTLADFRVQHVEFLDGLFTNGIAGLLNEGLVTMERVAQDGVKVRASAGAASFRSRAKLEHYRQEAKAQVETLKSELAADPGAGHRRQKAAQERAARDRAARLERALEQLPEVAAAKKPKDRAKARASMTDADARVMKMGDGGYRPAFNVQLATDTQTQIITAVEVTNSGGDQGKLAPMVEQHQERYDQRPKEYLADGGFAKNEDIERIGAAGTTVYVPVQASKDPNRSPHTPRQEDGPEVAAWRQRMGTPEAQAVYKERASTAECVNAQARNRGLQQFRVRGLAKVKAVVLWYVLVHNLMRVAAVRAEREKDQNGAC